MTDAVLSYHEAECYVKSLQVFTLKDVGSQKWFQQHEYLERLNMQAINSAHLSESEFIKDLLVDHGKLPVLIFELILTEVWRKKIFAKFKNESIPQTILFPIYMVLYHEVTLANILETIMYHKDSCEAVEDNILDLIDYCVRQLTKLCSNSNVFENSNYVLSTSNETSEMSTYDELRNLSEKLHFDICVKCISLMRYFTDHLENIPLSASSCLLNTHDAIILLVQFVIDPPWTASVDGQLKKYYNNKWNDVNPSQRLQLTKIEGQIWISLYQLLLSETCQRKYEITSSRKNTILRLRGHINEVTIDQMPILGALQHYLEMLSLSEPPTIGKSLVIEQVPEILECIMNSNKNQWKDIVAYQITNYFTTNNENLKEIATKLADFYSNENVVNEAPKCALCGEIASKRCSRCRSEWYCKRECQVTHWSKHKSSCDLILNNS